MLKKPSLVHVVAVPYSGDPSLNLPGIKAAGELVSRHRAEIKQARRDGMGDVELAELRAKHKAEMDAAQAGINADRELLDAAKETGDYSRIVDAGAKPTWFHLRVIPGTAMREMYAAMQSGATSVFKEPAIAFRCAIVKIENLDGVTIEFVNDPTYGKIATEAIVDALDLIDPSIVTELGYYAIGRASPKAG